MTIGFSTNFNYLEDTRKKRLASFDADQTSLCIVSVSWLLLLLLFLITFDIVFCLFVIFFFALLIVLSMNFFSMSGIICRTCKNCENLNYILRALFTVKCLDIFLCIFSVRLLAGIDKFSRHLYLKAGLFYP